MSAFAKIFLREWKYLWKHPRSFVLLIGIPLLVTFICGSSYEKGYFSDLKMGVVDYSYSKQTREVVEAFRQSPYFDVVGYYEDEDAIAEAMRDGEIVGCIVFPADFTRKLQLGQQAEVLLGSNATNMGYGSTINLKGSEVLGTVSTQMAVKSLVAKGSTVEEALAKMNPVGFYTRQWYNPTNNFSYFLTFGFVIATVQQVLVYFAAACLVREKEEGQLEELRRISPNTSIPVLAKTMAYFLISLLTWAACSAIILKGYAIPMKGSWLVWLGYSSLFLLAVICMGQLFSAALPKSNLATSVSLAFTSPSLVLSGFTWPLIAMPAFYQKLAQIFPLSHFVLGYRNVALMGCGFSDIRTDMIVLAGIAGGCLVCSCILWHRRLERIQKTTGLDVSEETMPMQS